MRGFYPKLDISQQRSRGWLFRDGIKDEETVRNIHDILTSDDLNGV